MHPQPRHLHHQTLNPPPLQPDFPRPHLQKGPLVRRILRSGLDTSRIPRRYLPMRLSTSAVEPDDPAHLRQHRCRTRRRERPERGFRFLNIRAAAANALEAAYDEETED